MSWTGPLRAPGSNTSPSTVAPVPSTKVHNFTKACRSLIGPKSHFATDVLLKLRSQTLLWNLEVAGPVAVSSLFAFAQSSSSS